MRKILVVDDEPDIRQILTGLLSMHGYEVIAAENGKLAFEMFLNNIKTVQLIVTDIAMPVMTGMELEQRIHSLLPEIKIIALTGSADVHERLVKLEQQFSAVIQKPFDFEKLVQNVSNMLD